MTQSTLNQIMAAEDYHSSKGYSLGNQADYEAFAAKRQQSTPYNPDADVRELHKWLNEEPNRPLDRTALARVLAYLHLQQ